ncbi:hypothetical protein EXIGLDRAFT_729842 [Exidia glandulosa HHB12029]|uniref:Uncharacterized protein n=1 Tax=Exidia glandulosa HHB12029 TaxID=1314781 RepID=A0A165CEY3_EXIGL|nr:hypothetical protein EXIGLDRAFT_729842 [Exidia glandulosa HHB12029]
MFCTPKLLLAATLFCSLFSSALGHAAIAVSQADADKIQRSQAVRPKNLDSCPDYKGPVGAAPVAADGTVTLIAKHFNPGKDGSTFFNAALSLTGEDGSFQNPLEIVQNGEEAPKEANGQDTIVVKIPGGLPCGDGTCTLVLQSKGGFGNCVRIVSEGDTPGGSGSASTEAPSATATTGGSKAKATCRPKGSTQKAKRAHARDFMGADMFYRRAD